MKATILDLRVVVAGSPSCQPDASLIFNLIHCQFLATLLFLIVLHRDLAALSRTVRGPLNPMFKIAILASCKLNFQLHAAFISWWALKPTYSVRALCVTFPTVSPVLRLRVQPGPCVSL